MTARTNVKEFIRRLFNVAEDNAASEAEIEQAMRIALHECHRHQLTRDDIFDSEEGEPDVSRAHFDKRHTFARNERLATWELELMRLVDRLNPTCGSYYSRGQLREGNDRKLGAVYGVRLTWYGPADDAQYSVDLFHELSLAMTTVAAISFGESFQRGRGAAYCEGFVAGVQSAHIKEWARLRADSTSTALVAVSDERAKALRDAGREWLAANGVRLGSGGPGRRGTRHLNRDAHQQGKADGASYHFAGRKAGNIE